MEHINDDCLLEINRYLNDKDRIQLSKVFIRFRYIMQPIWQRKYEYINPEFFVDIKKAQLNNSEIRFLIANICESIKHIDLRLCTPKQIKLMSTYVFPKVEHLKTDYIDSIDFEDNIEPSDHIDLNAMFPNVYEFIINGHFSWNNFILPKRLQQLTVHECPEFKWHHFLKVLKELPLTLLDIRYTQNIEEDDKDRPLVNVKKNCTLECLALEYKYLPWLMRLDFKNFQNLKELCIISIQLQDSLQLICQCLNKLTTYVLDKPIEMKLEMDVVLLTTEHQLLQNVEKLTITCFGEKIWTYFERLPRLREVMLDNCDTCERNELFQILNFCKNLHFINITNCVFPIPELTINVADIMKDRTEIVICNFHNNVHRSIEAFHCQSIVPMKYKFIGKSDLFHVTNEKITELKSDANTFRLILEQEGFYCDIW